MTFTWSDDAVATMRRLAAEGAAPLQVAEALGTTRSAVCGKARRVGVRFSRGVPRHGVARTVALLDDVLAMRPPEADGTVLWELRRTQCRYLLADGAPWVFCGAPTVKKYAYCAEHARRIYVPFKPSKEKDRCGQSGAVKADKS